MHQVQGTTFDENVLSAWQQQVVKAGSAEPKPQLLSREDQLLPRFAKQYQKLSRLPRRMRYSLQRQWKQSLAGIALLLILGQAPALAATINVGGSCTLARAITAANGTTTAGETCTNGATGADTINLVAASKPTFAVANNSVYGPTAL